MAKGKSTKVPLATDDAFFVPKATGVCSSVQENTKQKEKKEEKKRPLKTPLFGTGDGGNIYPLNTSTA